MPARRTGHVLIRRGGKLTRAFRETVFDLLTWREGASECLCLSPPRVVWNQSCLVSEVRGTSKMRPIISQIIFGILKDIS